MRGTLALLAAAAALAAACATYEPRYIEAYGHFGSGDAIAFKETSTLMVGPDGTTGNDTAIVRAIDPTEVQLKGVEIQADLTQVAAGGSYQSSHTGAGPLQIRLHLPAPGGGTLDTVQYTADGDLEVLELPVAGNNRFSGSFTNVVVNYDGQDVTIDNGTFRGQLP
ncbi:MAG TPA: hypothetical protein VGQ83_42895 [Polyangia bacterium]|jgi:hypothetical protein